MTQENPLVSLIIPSRNAAERTRLTVLAHLEAARWSTTGLEVIIVDDFSCSQERNELRRLEAKNIRILENEQNLGRGASINKGARAASGDLFLIVDCDCPPASANFFSRHLGALNAKVDVSVGALRSRDSEFWSRYQDDAVLRRETQFSRGAVYAFTSQNVMLGAQWFRRIGGFDEKYTRYGFEDRDFFIRLAASGARIAYTPSAGVVHEDTNIRLATIAPKMAEAGEHTSPQFRDQQVDAYRLLGYAAIDARLHPTLRPLGLTLGRFAMAAAPRIDPWLQRMPFAMAKAIAKAITALAFLYGTSRTATTRFPSGS